MYCKPFIKRSFNSLWVRAYNSKFISLFRLVLSARLRNLRITLKRSLFSESEIAQFIRSEVCYQKRVSPDKREYQMIKWLSIPSSDRCIKFRLRAHILDDIIKKQLKQFILRHIKVNLNLIGLLKCVELNAAVFEYLNFWIWVSIIDFFFQFECLLNSTFVSRVWYLWGFYSPLLGISICLWSSKFVFILTSEYTMASSSTKYHTIYSCVDWVHN